MIDKGYKAFIVEGEDREPLIIDNISRVFFKHVNFKIITLPAEKNIYMLWNQMKEDEFDTDIIEVLRENDDKLKEQLDGFSRDDFSEVYLFFDYDGHQENLGHENADVVLKNMLDSFDNETENGKLYISYPMVEALRDFIVEECGSQGTCYISITDCEKYKRISAERSQYPQFKRYDFSIWEKIIASFAMRISCMMNQAETIDYNQYIERITPTKIYELEQQEIAERGIFVLSAFPEFLLDYFGQKLWKKCAEGKVNSLNTQKCRQ